MKMEDILLLTEDYFESGFNGTAWNSSLHPEVDIYYYDIRPITYSLDLKTELKISLDHLLDRQPGLALVDDGSMEAHIVQEIAPQIEVIKANFNLVPSEKFIEQCQRQYELDDAEMIWALYFAQQNHRPLIFTRWGLPVLNANYIRSTHESVGSPYLVYVENEKFHRLARAQTDLQISLSWNFLKSSPEIFRSFFLDPILLDWYKAPSGSDNYEATRTLLKKLLVHPSQDVPLHKQKWPLGAWSQHLQKVTPVQQASFPLHLLLEKILKAEASVNKVERDLYGS